LARKPIGQILKEQGLLTEEQIADVSRHQYQHGGLFGEAAIAQGFVTEVDVARALAKQHDLPFVNLEKGTIAPEVLKKVPAHVVREFAILPLKDTGAELIVAISGPSDLFHLDQVQFVLNRKVKPALATKSALRSAIQRLYGVTAEAPPAGGKPAAPKGDAAAAAAKAAGVEDDDAPIIRLVHQTLEEALRNRASDVHVEPFPTRVRVRYRVDGVLLEAASHPKHLQGPLLSRFKIMAGMDIAEKRRPQDGRIQVNLLSRDIDIRVSALPANHGESLVMRLLDKQTGLVSLRDLGFHPDDYKRFKSMIRKPNGIFLVTGPTGSGKTTTLYAALQELNRPDVKIITAENPVEYHIAGINQCEVRHKIGVDFGKILRAMLRQAPNIILVGEIRDAETANIAVQAALTGHLVFSTLHTNDAPSALTRLIDIGVKPFLVSTAVQGVMAQRLVRVLCPRCKTPHHPQEGELRAAGVKPSLVVGKTIYRAGSCGECRNSGYRGRLGVFELMEMDPVLRDLVFRGASSLKIRDQARLSGGMVSLHDDCVRKVLEGVTSLEEVVRAARTADVFEGAA
jgi:type IV pilus assembly protein PilB